MPCIGRYMLGKNGCVVINVLIYTEYSGTDHQIFGKPFPIRI